MENNLDTLDHLIAFRKDIHRHPELGFFEHETARKICAYLDELKVKYVSGLGGTGIVAQVVGARGESSDKSVGLRADMDALPLDEHSGVQHSSLNTGRMHACGHDGHTTMLLGALRYLLTNDDFSGTVYFIFQPAEEGVGGGRAMVDDGLFTRFSINEIFGLHNWPDLPVGKFGVIAGPIMASGDRFDIKINGRGGHGGLNPHGCIDPIRIAAELIHKAHTIVSREIDPLSPAVLSVCAIESGSLDGFNVIPDTAELSGTIRAIDDEARSSVRSALQRLCDSIGEYYESKIDLTIDNKFLATVNDFDAVTSARKVITYCFGEAALQENYKPSMASEDFSEMLAECPGAYIHVGAGDNEHTHGLHSQKFDFNDKIIPYGVELLSNLALESLEKQSLR
jgi:hippurate hydrolase